MKWPLTLDDNYKIKIKDSWKSKKPFYVQLERQPWFSFPPKFIRKIVFIGTVLVFLSHQAIPSPTKETSASFSVKETSNTLKEKININNAEIVALKIPNEKIILPIQPSAKHPLQQPEQEKENTTKSNWRTLTVKKGDNLSLIFSRLGLQPQQLHRMLKAGKETNKLKRLMPGQKLKINIEGKKLTALIYVISKIQSLHIDRDGEQFQVKVVTRNLEKRINYASGSINTSLFSASQQAGLSNQLTM